MSGYSGSPIPCMTWRADFGANPDSWENQPVPSNARPVGPDGSSGIYGVGDGQSNTDGDDG